GICVSCHNVSFGSPPRFPTVCSEEAGQGQTIASTGVEEGRQFERYGAAGQGQTIALTRLATRIRCITYIARWTCFDLESRRAIVRYQGIIKPCVGVRYIE